MQEVTLEVEGMSCNHCVQSVEGAVEKIGATGKVDLQNKTVFVQYDEKHITVNMIKEAIEEQGYEIMK